VIPIADVVGHGPLAGADEKQTLTPLRGDLIDPSSALHHGRMVKHRVAKLGSDRSMASPARSQDSGGRLQRPAAKWMRAGADERLKRPPAPKEPGRAHAAE
jgi:hypothetical protein